MSWKSKFLLTVAKSVVVPFVSTVAAKAGEAVGDLVAWRINPPMVTCDGCDAKTPEGEKHTCPSS